MKTAFDLLSKVQAPYPGARVCLILGDAANPLRLCVKTHASWVSVNIEETDLSRSLDEILPEIFALLDRTLPQPSRHLSNCAIECDAGEPGSAGIGCTCGLDPRT